MHPLPQKLAAVDVLKATAAQLVVLHHLSAYGPIAGAVEDAAPLLAAWLFDYGRMAVQVFLVVGGFLTARSLAPQGRPLAGGYGAALANRYLRLALPFLAALSLAVVCAAVARALGDYDYVPAAPKLKQAIAHVFLLPGLLGQDALTAGAWYVAIDLQLFGAMILLSWLAASAPRMPRLMPLLLFVAMCAAQLVFNRNPDYEDWAIYFFGSYGLGAATWWALRSRRPGAVLALLGAATLTALLVDFRTRLLVALATAAVLALAAASPRIERRLKGKAAAWLGTISYAQFLVHFPVLMLANAAFDHFDSGDDIDGPLALLLAWGLSLGAAAAFHRFVEAPAARLRLPLRRAPGYATSPYALSVSGNPAATSVTRSHAAATR